MAEAEADTGTEADTEAEPEPEPEGEGAPDTEQRVKRRAANARAHTHSQKKRRCQARTAFCMTSGATVAIAASSLPPHSSLARPRAAHPPRASTASAPSQGRPEAKIRNS